MNRINQEVLRRLASKYVWWKAPDEAVLMPECIIAQVMNIGDYADVLMLVSHIGEEGLRKVLIQAKAGQFNARSWHYWHYRLGLATVDHVPALPTRKFV
jgi:hypothetical protein